MSVKKEARLRGRFKEDIDTAVQRFVASVPFDWRLYKYDIEGSVVHAEMLARQKIISRKEFEKIQAGLQDILAEPDVKKRLLEFGIAARASTPEEISGRLKSDIDKWRKVTEKAGIQKQ